MNSMSGEKLKGIPYTGTLPAVLAGTKAGYLHRYKLYGNLSQSGTPTPENPIYPSECGERTKQLFDGEYPEYAVGSTIKYRPIYVGQGTFTLSTTFPQMTDFADLFFMAGNVSTGATTGNGGVWSERPITVESIDGYVTVGYRRYSPTHPNLRDYQTMLNLGSTALPFEPYGYKLPLTSGSTPVDIYLGESQTTRRIKKLVLDGSNDEDWGYYGTFGQYNHHHFYINTGIDMTFTKEEVPLLYCDAYKATNDANAINNYECRYQQSSTPTTIMSNRVYFTNDNYSSEADVRTALAAQPITLWIVMPKTTAILNEPLRKIGNYADTIDSTQTSAQIPTSANSTTISWGGQGLEPSQFDSIQEWVDIPTYKRVNGEWVEDT